MRKKTRFVLSVESLNQRIAPSGFAPAPGDTPPADTSTDSGGGSTNIGTPQPLPPTTPPKV